MKPIRFIATTAMAMVVAICTMAACAKGEIKKQPLSKPVPDWIQPDTIATAKLGNTLIDILFNSGRVRVYSVVPKETVNSDDIEVDDNFVCDSLLATLNHDQIVALRYTLLTSGSNYELQQQLVPLTPYCPEIAFEFKHKKTVAWVFVSLSDRKWGIRMGDKTLFRFNYLDGIMLTRFCNYFLSKKNTNKDTTTK